MSSEFSMRRRTFSLFAVFCLIALFSSDSIFTRRAAMQSKKVSNSKTESLIPDLGIGASLNGARPFPSNNAWNIDISRFPVHTNSANLIASIGNTTGLHPDFGTFYLGAPIGIPYVVVAGNQTRVPINFTDYGDQSDPGPYPVPNNAPIEGGAGSTGDRHVLTIDRDNWKLYELYYSFPINNGASWDASSGAVWNFNSNKLRPDTWTSADAAGLPIFPGLVRRDEVVQMAEIRHALRFTIQTSRRAYVYPATHQAGSTTNTNAPPMGLRVRLKSTFNVNNTNFSPNVRVILKAMQKYGMIVADNGSNWYVSGTHDPLWNDDELSVLSQVKGTDFEVVQTPNHLLMPVSDFDGDGKTDLAVFRPSNNVWYVRNSFDNSFRANQFGLAADKTTVADFDGDGKADIAIFRPSTGVWWIWQSSNGAYRSQQFGVNGDLPVVADYDADGLADIAVFRPSSGVWYIFQSSNNQVRIVQWGLGSDKPTPGDFDGDNRADLAVYRPSEGVWYILQSWNNTFRANQFGLNGDIPIPSAYLP